ncbi:MAG: hypothetical protein HY740_06600 [Chloroflexi bacterium]|nr:hypothetical protein [Chloroflexota bacterium]
MLQPQRPYFIWNADLSEDDVRAILAGHRGDLERIQMIVHVMQNARFDDIWKYVKIDDIVENWTLVKRMLWPKESKDLWAWALGVWGRNVSNS